jgi:hypothetical protein
LESSTFGWIGLVLLWGFSFGAVVSFVAGVVCLVMGIATWVATVVGLVEPEPPVVASASGLHR